MVVPECFAFVLENLPVTQDDSPALKSRCLAKEWRREILAIKQQLRPAVGPASESDLPEGLRDALLAPAAYCMECDGLRTAGHVCDPPFRGWKHADGTPFTQDEESGGAAA